MTTIGSNIAYFRKKAGFTQEELSEIMNITSQAISKWENDLSYPDLANAQKLACVLKVSMEELLNGDTKHPVATNADAEQIARRILVIHVQTAPNESYGTKATSSTVCIPVSVLLNAFENGTLHELLGEDITGSQAEMIINIIKQGVTGTIIDQQTQDVSIQITVEDYGN